jgi:PIN domain nuclease of toxin-antitoxin system
MYWYIEGDPLLSGAAQTLIQDASNEVLISLCLNRYGFQVLPILPTHAARLIG